MDVQFAQGGAFSSTVEQSYDTLLSALGTSKLEQCFFEAIQRVTDVDRIYCFEQTDEGIAPNLFCTWTGSPYPSELLDRYRMVYHRHDPVRDILPSIPRSSCASITFQSEEVRHDDYREVCFERFSLRHRLSVVKRVEDRCLTLNLTRRSRPFVGTEIAEITMLARISLPLFSQHDKLRAKTSAGNFSVSEMERRLEAAGKGFTRRELQVGARTIVGMSAEGAAIDLGISVASVLTYRQRAYRRTNVSNAMQLAALIMH